MKHYIMIFQTREADRRLEVWTITPAGSRTIRGEEIARPARFSGRLFRIFSEQERRAIGRTADTWLDYIAGQHGVSRERITGCSWEPVVKRPRGDVYEIQA